jgi:hypothetical protein
VDKSKRRDREGGGKGIREQETVALRKAYPVPMYQKISLKTLVEVAFSS